MITSDASDPYSIRIDHVIGSFADTFDFTIPSGSLGSSANPLYSTIFGVKTNDIVGLSYALYGGASTSDGAFYGVFSGNNTTYDIDLTGGAYHIYVTGRADGTKGGSYALNLVSGVPEAEAYAMLIAGLGLIGFVVRRRNG